MQLIQLALAAKTYIENLFQREEGQDFFEYLLIIAGISLVILLAAAITVPDLFDAVLEAVCTAIDGIGDGGFLAGAIDCDSIAGS